MKTPLIPSDYEVAIKDIPTSGWLTRLHSFVLRLIFGFSHLARLCHMQKHILLYDFKSFPHVQETFDTPYGTAIKLRGCVFGGNPLFSSKGKS